MGKAKGKRNKDLKVNTISHPNSRKALQVIKKMAKEKTRKKSKVASAIKRNILGEKCLWFKDNLVEGTNQYTAAMAQDLFSKYFSRFDNELEQMQLKRSIGKRGRQHASREDVIKITLNREKEEFSTAGIEMVDIFQQTQLQKLREWDGDLNHLQNFKLTRISEELLKKKIAKGEKSRPSSPGPETALPPD